VYKAQQVIKWIERWGGITIAMFALIVAFLTYVNGSVIVTNFDGSVKLTNFRDTSLCQGFLVNDPSSYLLPNTIPSEKEKEYLESKINCYRDQIQKNPNDAEAYTNIGESERRLGNLAGARKAHQKALELKPELQEANWGLALVEQDMGNHEAANQAIQDALTQNPNAIAYLYQGAIFHKQNDLKGAKVSLRNAIELDPRVQKLIKTFKLFESKTNWDHSHRKS